MSPERGWPLPRLTPQLPYSMMPSWASRVCRPSRGLCRYSRFGTLEFGLEAADSANDPPSVLTWQLGVSDIDAPVARCRKAGVEFELERNDPAPGWSYRRLLIDSPSGYRVALEGPNEA